MTGASEAAYVSGRNITLEDVIANEAENIRGCVEANREELEDDADFAPGSIADVVIYGPGCEVLAVLVPSAEVGCHVTRFNRDRSHPGPVAPVAEAKDQTAPQPKPARGPWRSFKVDRPGGGMASIVEGHGKTLDDAIAEAVEDMHLMIDSKLNPADYVVIEQDRVVCRVLAKDVLSESTWTESCDAEDDAIAKADADPIATTRGVITADTHAPKPFSPADLPELALSLARCELRDAVDALLGARFRCNEAHTGMEGLDGFAKRIVREIDYRADNTCTEAEYNIARVLLSVWGVTDGGVEPFDATPKPWTPCGALVENRWFAWVVPGEHRGQAVYSIGEAQVRVVDNEDLEEDGLSDDDWGQLLEKPPCRYVVLGNLKEAEVVETECTTWH